MSCSRLCFAELLLEQEGWPCLTNGITLITFTMQQLNNMHLIEECCKADPGIDPTSFPETDPPPTQEFNCLAVSAALGRLLSHHAPLMARKFPVPSQIQSHQMYRHSCACTSLRLQEMLPLPDIITSSHVEHNNIIPTVNMVW